MSRDQFASRLGFERNRESSHGLHCDEKVTRRLLQQCNRTDASKLNELIGNVQQIPDNYTYCGGH